MQIYINSAMTRILMFALLAISLANAMGDEQACAYKRFPLFVGGDQGEDVSCMFTDPTSGQIIFGGLSTSATFAPAENDHGYMVALDQEGYWQWGNFFYNVSYSVQEVTGCGMTSNNTYIYAFG